MTRIKGLGGLLLGLALIAPAASARPLDGVAPGVASSNVEYVTTVPLEAGSPTGVRLVGDHLYVAGAKSFSIYDVSDPENPAFVSMTPVGFYFANEDVDTNGRILLLASDQPQIQGLFVYDVEDKENPSLLGSLTTVRDHNFACVFDCTYAYGSRGSIIDLQDPTAPERVGIWGVGMNPNDGFDTTETVPGLVIAATRPLQVIDGRKDPVRPKIVARGTAPDQRLLHSVEWPRRGKDRFVLVQGETFAETRCDGDSGALMTFDASRWKRTHTLTMIDEYRSTNGSYADGRPLVNAAGCTAMWFDAHRTFRNGGLVAASWFEHGTRFLEIDRKGRIGEVGYFLPAAGSSIASYWITDDIVYSIDLVRGIDILRFHR